MAGFWCVLPRRPGGSAAGQGARPTKSWMKRMGAGAGWFRGFHLEIYYYRILAAADYYRFAWLVLLRVDLLVRHVGRHVDEIARAGFVYELEVVAPAHSGAAADYIENGFELAVMMRACPGVRLYYYGA